MKRKSKCQAVAEFNLQVSILDLMINFILMNSRSKTLLLNQVKVSLHQNIILRMIFRHSILNQILTKLKLLNHSTSHQFHNLKHSNLQFTNHHTSQHQLTIQLLLIIRFLHTTTYQKVKHKQYQVELLGKMHSFIRVSQMLRSKLKML